MTQYGFYFDAENCIGCHTCQVACKQANRLETGENYRTVKSYCGGTGWDLFMYHVSMACNHCTNPACMNTCATGAIYKSAEDGLVLIDRTKCNGCGSCAQACPYGAIAMIAEDGLADKCDGCGSLRAQGEQPVCVASCPQRVLEFGDIEELRAAHSSEGLVSEVCATPGAAQANPNLVMRIKQCMTDPNFEPYMI